MQKRDEIIIRSPLPGEYGWITQVHGKYYADTFGWYEDFERIVANIMVEYLGLVPSVKQACFIAEHNGQPVGCIMLMEKSMGEGKVRVMYVSESVRGKGVGTTLINALIDKAKAIGYSKLNLWTTNNQIGARQLYKKIGFRLISKSQNVTFAKGSFDEEWQLSI